MPDGFIKRGGPWVLGQALLMLAVFPGGVIWGHHWQSRATGLIGALLFALAAVCGITGTVSLGKNLSPFPVPTAGARLVRNGIYGLIRHPLYTTVFLGALGCALVFASWPALAAALCLGWFFDAKARVEERALRRHFPEYAQYEKRVKRFIPFVY